MNGEKKSPDFEFTPGSCLAGVALLVDAVIILASNGHKLNMSGYEGLQGFWQVFLSMVMFIFSAGLVFYVGAALYQFLLLRVLDEWKVTASPLVKLLIICLTATAIVWFAR